MPDIDVIALIPIQADRADAARPHLRDLAEGTRGEEGCVAYALSESATTPGLFITTEQWRSQEDLQGHMSTPHVARAFEVLTPWLAGEVAVHPLVAVS